MIFYSEKKIWLQFFHNKLIIDFDSMIFVSEKKFFFDYN